MKFKIFRILCYEVMYYRATSYITFVKKIIQKILKISKIVCMLSRKNLLFFADLMGDPKTWFCRSALRNWLKADSKPIYTFEKADSNQKKHFFYQKITKKTFFLLPFCRILAPNFADRLWDKLQNVEKLTFICLELA